MRVPESLKPYPLATIAEIERMNWLERRIATLEKWIEERDGLTRERDEIVAFVKARSEAPAPDAGKTDGTNAPSLP